MSKLMIAMFVAAGLGVAGNAVAQTYAPKATMAAPTSTAPMSKDSLAAARKSADAQYKLDRDACASLSGNANDICIAEAKGKDNVAKADAEAAYENTPKAREHSRIVRAEAAYAIAIERCDDLAGNPKDVCVKEGKAALVRGKADARVDRVVADTRNDAAVKQSDARVEASVEKRDADYKVAIEKCDALAGPSKDACVSSAKMQFGKS